MAPSPAQTRFRFVIAALVATLVMLLAEYVVFHLLEGRAARLSAGAVGFVYAIGLAAMAARAFPCAGASGACDDGEEAIDATMFFV